MAEPASEISDAQPMAVNDEQGASAPALDFVPPPKPQFRALSAHEMSGGKFEFRKVFVPSHRFTPLKEHWMEIYTPVFEQMKIDIRMNLKVHACFRVSLFGSERDLLVCFRALSSRFVRVFAAFDPRDIALIGFSLSLALGARAFV